MSTRFVAAHRFVVNLHTREVVGRELSGGVELKCVFCPPQLRRRFGSATLVVSATVSGEPEMGAVVLFVFCSVYLI